PSTLSADEWEVLDHTTGTTWDREAELRSWRYLLRAEQPTCRHEPLAILGDSLALFRLSASARGFTGTTFDVGAYTREIIALTEVDAQGRRRRAPLLLDRQARAGRKPPDEPSAPRVPARPPRAPPPGPAP